MHATSEAEGLKFKITALLIFMLVFSVADLIISTVYYNFFDSRIQELEVVFGSGRGTFSCGSREEITGDNPHPEPAHCTGGILGERDAYLKSNHVIGLGGWYRGDYQDTQTFQIYFWYAEL